MSQTNTAVNPQLAQAQQTPAPRIGRKMGQVLELALRVQAIGEVVHILETEATGDDSREYAEIVGHLQAAFRGLKAAGHHVTQDDRDTACANAVIDMAQKMMGVKAADLMPTPAASAPTQDSDNQDENGEPVTAGCIIVSDGPTIGRVTHVEGGCVILQKLYGGIEDEALSMAYIHVNADEVAVIVRADGTTPAAKPAAAVSPEADADETAADVASVGASAPAAPPAPGATTPETADPKAKPGKPLAEYRPELDSWYCWDPKHAPGEAFSIHESPAPDGKLTGKLVAQIIVGPEYRQHAQEIVNLMAAAPDLWQALRWAAWCLDWECQEIEDFDQIHQCWALLWSAAGRKPIGPRLADRDDEAITCPDVPWERPRRAGRTASQDGAQQDASAAE